MGMGTVISMTVDFVSVARKRRLTALEGLGRRHHAISRLGKLKFAPLQYGDKVVPIHDGIVFALDRRQVTNESLRMPLPLR